MKSEEIKALIDIDTCAFDKNLVASELLLKLDKLLLSTCENISIESFSIYKKFVVMKQDAPSSMKSELFCVIRNYIKEQISQGLYADALLMLRFLLVKSEIFPSDLNEIAQVLFKLGDVQLGLNFIKLYEKAETNLPLKYLTLANIYNLELKDYKTAINYYEKYIKIDETKSVVYTILASLYQKAYGDIGLNDQISYFKKAYNLNPKNRLVLHGLAYAYERLGDKELSNRYYLELLENNPTDIDYYNYGMFLISCGDFETGHKYFTHRFLIEDANLKYPVNENPEKKWDCKSDITDKTLLVHYEQGFGDTFMYCRFVPQLKRLAKKIIFVVQDNLYELLKQSPIIADGIEIISEKTPINEIQYDYHMALLDAPYALNAGSNNMPYPQGYLTVDENLVEQYRQKFIKSTDKFKIGIAYSGDKNANYNGRDIDICKFNKLFNLKNIEFYSLQYENQILHDSIINLGDTFNNFTDTACAIKNMDLVISTDNVILNLAGALGVKTFGLFNLYPNFRWYQLIGEDTGWYKFVKPFQTEENNRWSIVFSKIYQEIENFCKYKTLNT